VTITWDGTTIPSVPNPLTTDISGNFTALISVPTQIALGVHTTDESGNWATATLTVVDMTGPQGPKGVTGALGPTGFQGQQGPKGDRELLDQRVLKDPKETQGTRGRRVRQDR
jgi:hypothetical protein